jgi:hypothetical protein
VWLSKQSINGELKYTPLNFKQIKTNKMVNFNQKSEQINLILNKWYGKHYSHKLSHSPKYFFSTEMIWEDMAVRLGNTNFEKLVYEFSMEDRVSSISELEVSEELFNNFYQSVINYKF